VPVPVATPASAPSRSAPAKKKKKTTAPKRTTHKTVEKGAKVKRHRAPSRSPRAGTMPGFTG
jgi:hypothetical protein